MNIVMSSVARKFRDETPDFALLQWLTTVCDPTVNSIPRAKSSECTVYLRASLIGPFDDRAYEGT